MMPGYIKTLPTLIQDQSFSEQKSPDGFIVDFPDFKTQKTKLQFFINYWVKGTHWRNLTWQCFVISHGEHSQSVQGRWKAKLCCKDKKNCTADSFTKQFFEELRNIKSKKYFCPQEIIQTWRDWFQGGKKKELPSNVS